MTSRASFASRLPASVPAGRVFLVLAVVLSAGCGGCASHGGLGGPQEEAGQRPPRCPATLAAYRDAASPVLGTWYGFGISEEDRIIITPYQAGGRGAALTVCALLEEPDVEAGPDCLRDASFCTAANYRDGVISLNGRSPDSCPLGGALVSIRMRGIPMLVPCSAEGVLRMLEDRQHRDPTLPFALLASGAFMRLPDYIQGCVDDYERPYR